MFKLVLLSLSLIAVIKTATHSNGVSTGSLRLNKRETNISGTLDISV